MPHRERHHRALRPSQLGAAAVKRGKRMSSAVHSLGKKASSTVKRAAGTGTLSVDFDLDFEAFHKTWVPILTELVATLMFVYCGAGVTAITSFLTNDTLDTTRVIVSALTEGVAYITLAYMVEIAGGRSVGYLNPAITLGIGITNKAHGRYQWVGKSASHRVMYLMLAQIIGSILGGALVLGTVPNSAEGKNPAGAPCANFGTTAGTAMMWEMFGAMVVTWITMATTCRKKQNSASASLAIGSAFLSLKIAILPYTGAALNPVRALGPMVASGEFTLMLAVYTCMPMAGGVAAAVLYILLFTPTPLKETLGFDPKCPDDPEVIKQAKHARREHKRHDKQSRREAHEAEKERRKQAKKEQRRLQREQREAGGGGDDAAEQETAPLVGGGELGTVGEEEA